MKMIDMPDWENLVELYKNYDGRIIDFCKQHNINTDSFYYYRKKYETSNTTSSQTATFHKIEVSNTVSTTHSLDLNEPMLKLEIGKATLHIPVSINENILNTLMRTLISSC